jgi:single-stranded-DNA-specific exonuclease
MHEWEYALREPLTEVYRTLREAGPRRGDACEAVLRGSGRQPRTPAMAGRLVRVLTELDLAAVDGDGFGLRLADAPARTSLERSPAFIAYGRRLEDGRTFLTSSTSIAA